MPVLVIADLHLDLWLRAGCDPLTSVDPEVWASLDAVIIAGDLANKPKVSWPHMIRHLGRYIAPERIHLLPGNHDYYYHTLDGDARLAEICAEVGARFVQKGEIVISATRFLCCTIWTDFALYGDPASAMRTAEGNMNDYRCIRLASAGYRRIRPSDTAIVHADHRQWLEERLALSFEGRTVVVTHHCPHPDLISATRGAIDPAYGSNLLGLMEAYQPEDWLFGHTHYHVEAKVGRTLVKNISLGYPGQVPPDEIAKTILRGIVETGSFEGRPYQEAIAVDDLSDDERNQLSNLLEAELPGEVIPGEEAAILLRGLFETGASSGETK